MTQLTNEQELKFAHQALSWHGWASPVGLGIFFVSLALAALVVRLAIYGLG